MIYSYTRGRLVSDHDQPAVYTTSQLRELDPDSEGHQAMVDTCEAAPTGSEVLIPFNDGSHVSYVYDGRDLWHRRDTKAAQMLRNTAERQVVGRG